MQTLLGKAVQEPGGEESSVSWGDLAASFLIDGVYLLSRVGVLRLARQNTLSFQVISGLSISVLAHAFPFPEGCSVGKQLPFHKRLLLSLSQTAHLCKPSCFLVLLLQADFPKDERVKS